MSDKIAAAALRKKHNHPHAAAHGTPDEARSARLWDLEFGLTVATNAFQRWIVRCMARAGCEGLSPLDVMVLHAINRRAPSRSLGDIALLLNMDDNRAVAYSAKKLMSEGLLESRRRGKENIFSTTAAGAALCDSYIQVRERLLMELLLDLSEEDWALVEKASRLLMKVGGAFDHAARAAIG
jgi:predicted MarR family transcription regulator